MASENAKAVAQAVIENVGKGRKVSKRKIIKNQGYSQNIADNPKKVTETQSYQEVIKPVVKKMEKERTRLINALSKKDLTKEKYRDMIEGVDKLTKNIQLLTGGKTANDSLNISWDK